MGTPLRIAITGASGLVGQALLPALRAVGHTPIPLVRGAARAGEIHWDPDGVWDNTPLHGIEAVIHLAGANIAGHRWTRHQKDRIEGSRVNGTGSLVDGIATLHTPPRVLISASAMGFYGDRGDDLLDENSPSGHGWLANVARNWEGAAHEAQTFGTRVVITRFGLILSPDGGALQKLLLPFRLGLGGRLGPGTQWMSWITLGDTVRAILAALDDDRYSGAINVASPNPVTNAEFTKTLGRVLRRPTPFPVPTMALRLLFGEMADATLLASQRMIPQRLSDLDFRWEQPRLEGALRSVLGR